MSRVPWWHKSHQKTLREPTKLMQNTHASLSLRAFCVEHLSNLDTVLTAILLFRNISLSSASILTDVNSAENVTALFLKAMPWKNTPKTTDAGLIDKESHFGWRMSQRFNIGAASQHLACKLPQKERPFESQSSFCLCEGWVKGQWSALCDTSLIFLNQPKNRRSGLFAYSLTCA